MPGSHQAPREALEARATLSALLETAYGSAEDGRVALERALRGANRSEVPSSVQELLAFVRIGLLPVLSDDLGPRVTMALLEDFIGAHEIRSGISPKGPVRAEPSSPTLAAFRPPARGRPLNVLLLDADRLARTTLARALARARCEITAIGSLEELGEVLRSKEPIDAAVLDGRHPAKLLILEIIADRYPGASIVVRSEGDEAMRALLDTLGVVRFEVLPVSESPESITGAVLRLGAAR